MASKAPPTPTICQFSLIIGWNQRIVYTPGWKNVPFISFMRFQWKIKIKCYFILLSTVTASVSATRTWHSDLTRAKSQPSLYGGSHAYELSHHLIMHKKPLLSEMVRFGGNKRTCSFPFSKKSSVRTNAASSHSFKTCQKKLLLITIVSVLYRYNAAHNLWSYLAITFI